MRLEGRRRKVFSASVFGFQWESFGYGQARRFGSVFGVQRESFTFVSFKSSRPDLVFSDLNPGVLRVSVRDVWEKSFRFSAVRCSGKSFKFVRL